MTKKDCEILVDIVLELHVFFDSEESKAALWLSTKNPHLGMCKPIDLIERGKILKVHQFIIGQLSENRVLNENKK